MMRSITPRKVKMGSVVYAVLFLLIFNIQFALAQFKTHNLGKFKFEHQSNESLDYTGGPTATGQWPQDVYRSGNFTMNEMQRHVGSYTDDTGTLQSKTTHGGASLNGEDPFTITEYRRYEPPTVLVYVDGALQESSIPYDGIIDPDLPCDIMVVNRFKASPGFHGVSRSYSFSNSNHDDYIIYKSTYTFTGDHDADEELEVQGGLSDVYFAIGYNMQTVSGTWISYSRWYEEGKDEWTDFESVPSTLVPGGRNLTISYSWDGDYPEVTEFVEGDGGGPNGNFDDTGDPRWALGEEGPVSMPSGELISPTYSGFALIYADDPGSPGTDDITQPLSIISGVSVYDMWDAAFPGFNTLFDWAASGQRTDRTSTSGYADDDPSQLEGDYPWQSVGPYNFNVGDSITFVHVIASNGISRELAIEKGLEWRSWYRGEAGATFDDAAKDELLASGKDSLFQTIDRAFWAWSRDLDVPDPLPAPDLTVNSGPNRIDLEWEDLSAVGDPDTDQPDLDHYNIYRKLGSFLVDTDDELREDGTHLVWQLIASVPASQTTYSDESVIRGENYHYAVTAVDDGTQNTNGLFPGQKLESSLYANRSEIAAKAFLPGEDNSDNVLIVPNPFISGAQDFNFAGTRSNTILFVNLPSYCTLRIYTVTGDLIKKIEHSSGSADDEWDLITETNQFVASGVYILKVSNAKDLAGNSISETIEKFVVIR
jgi:hypothetical protein